MKGVDGERSILGTSVEIGPAHMLNITGMFKGLRHAAPIDVVHIMADVAIDLGPEKRSYEGCCCFSSPSSACGLVPQMIF